MVKICVIAVRGKTQLVLKVKSLKNKKEGECLRSIGLVFMAKNFIVFTIKLFPNFLIFSIYSLQEQGRLQA
jgi:hypothetical protein